MAEKQRPVYSQSFNRGGGGGGGGYRRNDRSEISKRNGESTRTVMVDTTCIGRIVGKGGSNIRDMEEKSHCRIFVDKYNRTDKTEIRVTGQEEADVQKACNMIEELASSDHSDSRNWNRQDRRYNDNSDGGRPRQDDRGHRRDDRNNQREHNGRFGHNERESFDANKNSFSRSTDYSEKPDNTQQPDVTENVPDDGFVPVDWTTLLEESDRASNEALAKMPKLVKRTYTEAHQIANMSPEEVALFRHNNMKITVARVFSEHEGSDKPIPNPILTFDQAFGPHPEVMQTIRDQGFDKPSPIQCQAWPVIMSGEDLIGIAQTGTGKTLAFLLPAFLHIEAQTVPREKRVGPTVLILSPTRELAQQIEKEINKYSYRNIKCVCVYGGGNRKEQLTSIKRERPEIIVATPGRLDDFVMAGEIKMESVSYTVLDEADKMLEMGFECQIRKILIAVRKDRQSIMTSATWPSNVRRLASQYSVNPVQVVVGSLDLAAVHSVSQDIIMADEEEKRSLLSDFLQNLDPDDKVIVFCGKKSVTDDIASDLALNGVRCQSLHGDREQIDREQALHDLKTGEVRILIATDVAARGIDIPDITHIFNFDFPKNIEEYVHRIGRTGRAGRTGKSISLFCRRDWANAGELIKILQEANQGVPEELIDMAERFEKRKERDMNDRRSGRGGGGRGRGGRGRY